MGEQDESSGTPKSAKEPKVQVPTDISLGDLITIFYDEFLALYEDEEKAAVAAAAVINDMIDQSKSMTGNKTPES